MKNQTLVVKFGGTSVGSTEAILQVINIIKTCCKEWSRVVVVTSAMSGITNLLLETAAAAAQGETYQIIQAALHLKQKHTAVIDNLIPDLARRERVKQDINNLVTDFTNLCQAISILGEASPRALDSVAGLGERICVRVLSAVLEAGGITSQYVEATQLIVTDDRFQSAHPDMILTTPKVRMTLEPILARGNIPVITGFIGATQNGIATTLGRGGSDYSAAIIGAVLPADEVWIMTDVDGVMTSDPRIIKDARTIPELSYSEISELAYFGAKVVHPKTIRPVIEAGIGLRICNSFNPTHPGTRIQTDKPTVVNQGVIKAVTAIQGLQLVTVEGGGMLGVPGVAARTFVAVATTGTSVPLITQASSEQSICFMVPVEATSRVITALETAFAPEIASQDIDRIWATGEVVIITAVGSGMISTPGVSGRLFTALGDSNVNVIAIAQGSSEVAISIVVDGKDAQTAIMVLHRLISK